MEGSIMHHREFVSNFYMFQKKTEISHKKKLTADTFWSIL